jgi:hypothetical protein
VTASGRKRIVVLRSRAHDLVDLCSVRMREIQNLPNWSALPPGAKVKFDLIKGDLQDALTCIEEILAFKKE